MRIRSTSDVFATAIAWLPILIVVGAVFMFLAQTGLFLEVNSEGTEVFMSNDASVEHWNRAEVQEHQAAKRELAQG